jgi:D-amino peptidase
MMKIYISVDFEGGAAIVGEPDKTLTDSKQYDFARREMTAESNAAIRGAFAGGATEVILDDSHGSGVNLIYDELDPRARILLGAPRPRRFQAIDGTCSGLALVGYHPMAGTRAGVLAHSYSSRKIQNLWLNGRLVGEIGMDAALAGSLGVPVILVSSCTAGCAEAKDLLGDVETMATKEGLSRNSAISLAPTAAHALIEEGMERAVKRARGMKPFVVDPPYTVRTEYKLASSADSAARRPGARRIDGRNVEVTGDDIFAVR